MSAERKRGRQDALATGIEDCETSLSGVLHPGMDHEPKPKQARVTPPNPARSQDTALIDSRRAHQATAGADGRILSVAAEHPPTRLFCRLDSDEKQQAGDVQVALRQKAVVIGRADPEQQLLACGTLRAWCDSHGEWARNQVPAAVIRALLRACSDSSMVGVTIAALNSLVAVLKENKYRQQDAVNEGAVDILAAFVRSTIVDNDLCAGPYRSDTPLHSDMPTLVSATEPGEAAVVVAAAAVVVVVAAAVMAAT